MILVFGASGQVATELSEFNNVQTLSRDACDVTNTDAIAQTIHDFAPSAVINATAYTAVDRAETDVDLAYAVNATAPRVMAQICRDLNIPFVHISTDYVFDGSGAMPWAPDAQPNPVSVYGASKLAGEQAVIETGADAVILRTSWVFSPHGSNFVKTMLRLAQSRDHLSVVDDQIGGPTPARDLARAAYKIALDLITAPNKSGIYHFSGAPDVSWAGFANKIFEFANLTVKITPIPSADYPTPAKRPLNSRLNCQLTKEIFDIDQPNWENELIRIITGTSAQ